MIKTFGLTIQKRMSSRHSAIYITDTDYADDLAITSQTTLKMQIQNYIKSKKSRFK